ncbi:MULTISPECIES: hypothetical protein [Nocardia]|uniref:Uncharacterized protein n=1 Tax=Nocardia ignorata TaxID=145285 RepID=A0A4R6PVC7_NOCIG|nr:MULTISPECIES: hypothetical protein [Nocardia]MCA2206427.1 hypothetical protein [Nocardia rosealba]TDP42070.1 hypothetical protein DFR75_1011179 [Nocardia ignorata]
MQSFMRRFTTAVAATSVAAAIVFAGPAVAEPTETQTVDVAAAVSQLRTSVADNPGALAALDQLVADGTVDVALPAQPFQIPATSDIGQNGGGPGVYGSGIALDVDGFRFGFFGGPGTISPNQNGAKLEVMWLNLSNGQSGTAVLTEHMDVPVDTTIRTAPLNTGGGLIVAAVYGSLWHRWPDAGQPDGYAYRLGHIQQPSFGAVTR